MESHDVLAEKLMVFDLATGSIEAVKLIITLKEYDFDYPGWAGQLALGSSVSSPVGANTKGDMLSLVVIAWAPQTGELIES